MGETAERKILNPEAYLEAERNRETRHEYINGHILAMAGASRRHNQITFNIAKLLGLQLENRPCVAFVSDMRVKVSLTEIYAYPDLVATCQAPEFEDSHTDTLLNPSLIIEVLSDSTEAYDRGEKFAHYRRLPTLVEYVLIAQDKMRVEYFLRQKEQWLLSEFCQPDDRMALTSMGCELRVGDIYDKVRFF